MDCISVFMAATYALLLVSPLCVWTTDAEVFVDLTILDSAVAQGAVCLDGSPPAYQYHRGSGLGIFSWIVHIEGGGWCDTIVDCLNRSQGHVGSSKYMSTHSLNFTGILSENPQENPDFYNWNRIKLKYCDGASFTGDVEEVDPATNLHFRGARIFKALIEELLYRKGMISAHNAILSGSSAGGLAAIQHCDRFRAFLPLTCRVKCIPSAGFFLNAKTIRGEPFIEEYFKRVVTLHGSVKNLPLSCTLLTSEPSLCFFPQYAAKHILTPLFIANSAYDIYQMNHTWFPKDVHDWDNCKANLQNCTASQLQILLGYRWIFLKALNELGPSATRGYFITSCHTHWGIDQLGFWFNKKSMTLANKTIAEAVVDWFFKGSLFQEVDCPYPCSKSCKS